MALLAAATIELCTALLAQAGGAQALPADHAERMAKGLELFEKTIEPLLKERCLKCHGGEATRGQLDLATREALLAGGKNGEVAVPFDAESSRLLKLVRHEEAPAMPFKLPKLEDAQIDALSEWLDAGAPYSRPLVERKDAKKGPREVTDADRAFWSFRPLERPAPPEVRDSARCANAIDRFVQAKLEERGIAPAAPAPRRALLRRAWFDLVGLPPPPEEVEAFVADAAADAWPRRVDALLASPRFGERWGRHWLDVARFAESHGFEHDYDRPNAWTWRDYVIDALNRDQPFDEFVRWQIAGDELAPDDPQAWFATGFLGAGVHATQITASQVEKERYDELDDVVATIGTSMLGLTIGCARCHDHKFDPIPTRDYYRMVATFTKTVRSDFDVVLDPAEERARVAAWSAEQEQVDAPLREFEARELPQRLLGWLGQRRELGAANCGAPAPWTALDDAKVSSSGGAAFAAQEDGSWLASGPRAEHDEYTFVAPIAAGALDSIASLRLEALTDPSLVKGGPGRADNGNFGLTELRATWKPAGAGDATPLAFAGARSTFDQAGLPATAAIDGDDGVDAACWAVDPQFGKDHAAAFALAAPIAARGGGELTLTLLFRTNVFHSIGRLRVALAARAESELTADAIDATTASWLARFDRGDVTASEPGPGREALQRWFARRDPDWRRLHAAAQAHLASRPQPRVQKALVCSEGLPAIRLHTQGGDFLEETHFLKRGDPNQKLEVATPGFLQVLERTAEPDARWRQAPPADARTPWQRRALAEWITDVDAGGGALLARVAANRIWQHLFGRGIVATPSDFGAMGAKPTEPELLEWLACELAANGFRVKALLREIATSATYLQGAAADRAASDAADPENELFSRQPPRRLEAEAIRDAMLAVSGTLDLRMHGPGTLDVADPRRSVYLFVKRSRLVPMMSLFDAPNALSGVGRRQTTTVAPQSLFLMNSAPVRTWATALAERIGKDLVASGGAATDATFVRRAYELCFSRPPDDGELADSVAFLQDGAGSAADGLRSRVDLCQALLSANEFVYVE